MRHSVRDEGNLFYQQLVCVLSKIFSFAVFRCSLFSLKSLQVQFVGLARELIAGEKISIILRNRSFLLTLSSSDPSTNTTHEPNPANTPRLQQVTSSFLFKDYKSV